MVLQQSAMATRPLTPSSLSPCVSRRVIERKLKESSKVDKDDTGGKDKGSLAYLLSLVGKRIKNGYNVIFLISERLLYRRRTSIYTQATAERLEE